VALAAGGQPYLGVDLALGWRRYQFRPWPRLERRALERQLRRDMAIHSGPQDVRWVFSGQRLGLDRQEAVRQAQRLLVVLRRDPAARRWVEALDQIMMVV
jgi:hypothetical protein